MTSVYNLGCFGGALSTLYTGDKLGRPRSLIVGSLIIALGAIIQATVFGPTQMYVGRVVAGKPLAPHIMSLSMKVTDTHNPGIGTGINTSTAGVWQSETAKTASRGKLIIIQMANCITGFSISNWLTLGFSFVPGSASWRFPLAFQICEFCFICPEIRKFVNFHSKSSLPSSVLCVLFSPTLPVCLCARRNMKKLLRSLPRLKGTVQLWTHRQYELNMPSSKTSWTRNVVMNVHGGS